MGTACRECNGMSFVDNGAPCPTCSPAPEDAVRAFEISQRLARPEKTKTVEVMDGPTRPGMEGEVGMSPQEAGFSQSEIDAQNARDLQAMRGMARRR